MSRTTETINFDMYQGQFPIWGKQEVPRNAMVLIGAPDTDSCGDPQYDYFNLPLGRILPVTPSRLNTYSVKSDLEIPLGQVRAVYVTRNGFGEAEVSLAKPLSGQYARMIALGKDETLEGHILLQNTGFAYIQSGHEYTLAQKYYLDEDGTVSTNPDSDQELFTVVDSTTIAVNIQVK